MKRYNLYDMNYEKKLRASFDAIEEPNGEWVRWEDIRYYVDLLELIKMLENFKEVEK